MTEAFSAAASSAVRTQARLPESIRTAGQSRPFIRSSGLFIILLASPARLAAREKSAGENPVFHRQPGKQGVAGYAASVERRDQREGGRERPAGEACGPCRRGDFPEVLLG